MATRLMIKILTGIAWMLIWNLFSSTAIYLKLKSRFSEHDFLSIINIRRKHLWRKPHRFQFQWNSVHTFLSVLLDHFRNYLIFLISHIPSFSYLKRNSEVRHTSVIKGIGMMYGIIDASTWNVKPYFIFYIIIE